MKLQINDPKNGGACNECPYIGDTFPLFKLSVGGMAILLFDKHASELTNALMVRNSVNLMPYETSKEVLP